MSRATAQSVTTAVTSRSRRRELDREGVIRAQQVWLTPDEHAQRLTFLDDVALLIVGELDPDLPSAKSQREGELVPGARQPWLEGQLAAEVADATEPEDERGPYAGRGGDVDSVRGVAGHVAQVHQQRVLEVLQGLALLADLGGDDALHARRQG